MKKFQNALIQGTILLTAAGFLTRLIGFAYRIFLSHRLGASLLGVYQLVFPVYSIGFTIYGAGIQTAISQLIASNVGDPVCKAKKDLAILKWGLFASLTLAFSLMAFVFFFAGPIAAHFLLEPACGPYLRILCLLFPFCGVSACINGYFYGRKEAKVPACTQIVEQLVRVGSVLFLCLSLSAAGETGCRFAVLGIVLGEAASCFYSCIKLGRSLHASRLLSGASGRQPVSSGRQASGGRRIASSLLFLAFTLTTTKLVISVLHSAEAVFIPAALKKYGCSAQEALGIYGILSGIALPFILFPSTVTNSFAVMLLPAIAQAQAERSVEKIRRYVTTSCKYSLLIGYLFTCLFLLFGKEFGVLLFHSASAGSYIYTLSWLCPFLYLSTTLTSIINGLGKTQLTFFITAASLFIKIYFLICLVPRYGIVAYLTGTLISQIAMTLLEACYLKPYIRWSSKDFLALPCFCLAAAGILLKPCYAVLLAKKCMPAVALTAVVCLILCLFYVLILERLRCISRRDFS